MSFEDKQAIHIVVLSANQTILRKQVSRSELGIKRNLWIFLVFIF